LRIVGSSARLGVHPGPRHGAGRERHSASRDWTASSIRQWDAENECGAPLASPQQRPASPVNGAGGTTGCHEDAQARESFPETENF
jgi:hypothetical protein